MRISEVVRNKGGQVVTIGSDASVGDLLTLLSDHKIGAVVVSDDGQSVHGIVSERDIVRHLHATGADILTGPVRAIMTTAVLTVEPETDLAEVEHTMTEQRFRHLPVVTDGKLGGIVSIGDVVKHRIETLQAERDQLVGYIQQ